VKTIILAGGLGTRISEETYNKPKPMVEVHGQPLLWHVMSIFASQGYSDFIIAGGYRYDVIDRWVRSLDAQWKIKVIDTGLETQTGGRIRRCLSEVNDDVCFLTYGDGLGNVSLRKVLEVNLRNDSIATVTAVRPPARFGSLDIHGDQVKHFGEKSQLDAGWINGGFFVLNREISGYLDSDKQIFESEVLPKLARSGYLTTYQHHGFWKPMDTLREKNELEELAGFSSPPWLKIEN